MKTHREKFLSLTVVAFAVSVFISLAPIVHARSKVKINNGWNFFAGDLPDGATAAIGPDWQRIDLPHTWNVEDTHDDVPGYRRGVSWYRRELSIPDQLKSKRIYLYFEGANQTAELFVNGRRIGSHIGGYSAFTFDVTDALKAQGSNAVAVKVDNTLIQDIPPLDADFNMYGGIYRDVWLIAVDDVHLSFGDSASPGITISTPQVSAASATARVSAVIANKGRTEKAVVIRTTVYGPDGKQIAENTRSVRAATGRETQVSHDEMRVTSPKLWSPDSPSLYKVVTKIESDGRIIDAVSQPVGFRWFSFDADKGFVLNGKPLKLRGTNRHQDHAGLGNAVPDTYHVRDLEIIKENGFNFLRLAHYPQDPAVLETADRLGILIWEEIPIAPCQLPPAAPSRSAASALGRCRPRSASKTDRQQSASYRP
jgi:beta-galactosidase